MTEIATMVGVRSYYGRIGATPQALAYIDAVIARLRAGDVLADSLAARLEALRDGVRAEAASLTIGAGLDVLRLADRLEALADASAEAEP